MFLSCIKKTMFISITFFIVIVTCSCSNSYHEVCLTSSKVEYENDGTLKSRSEYSYDDYGNLVSEDIFNSENVLTDTIEYEYDENDNLVKETHESSIIEYIYDNDGNRVEEHYNVGSDSEWHRIYEYDENGNPIIQKDNYITGELVKYVEYIYDSYENLIIRIDYNSNGEKSSRTEYQYDLGGNQISEYWYDDENLVFLLVLSEYNEQNQLLRTNYCNSSERVNEYKTYKYDENGNLINSTYFDQNSGIISWIDYTYGLFKVKSK